MAACVLHVPPNLHPKAMAALVELLECVSSHYTGSYEVHFKDGIPQLRHRTETRRFGDHYGRGQEEP